MTMDRLLQPVRPLPGPVCVQVTCLAAVAIPKFIGSCKDPNAHNRPTTAPPLDACELVLFLLNAAPASQAAPRLLCWCLQTAEGLPALPVNARYWATDPSTCAHSLGVLGAALNAGLLDREKHQYFVLTGSHVRGPFLPTFIEVCHQACRV